jgi:hypothetical protein
VSSLEEDHQRSLPIVREATRWHEQRHHLFACAGVFDWDSKSYVLIFGAKCHSSYHIAVRGHDLGRHTPKYIPKLFQIPENVLEDAHCAKHPFPQSRFHSIVIARSH